MDRNDADRFVANVLVSLWPDWKPGEANIKLWVRKLELYEYSEAKRIVSDFKAESQISYKFPPTGKLLKRLSIYARKKEKGRKHEPTLLYEIFREDNLKQKQAFYSGSDERVLQNKELIEQEAERNREKMCQMYEGNWIILRHWEGATATNDDGLRGDEARKRAEEIILAGLDTPRRRFLQKYYSETEVSAGKKA